MSADSSVHTRGTKCLLVTFVGLLGVVGVAATTSGDRNSRAPAFPALLPADITNRDKWEKLGKDVLWQFLTQSDLEFVDYNGSTVPPAFEGAKVQQHRLCGRVARLWIRMPFHDCGTYDARTNKGGCNGSLRKEIPSTMPSIDPATGDVLLNDIFDSLGGDKKRADFALDPKRLENAGFAVSASFFYHAKFAAEAFGLKASWADIMVYGGLLSLAVCNGPHVLFVPGRIDSKDADPPGLLPAPSASLDSIMRAYQRMGLSSLDGITLQASHTTACFSVGCLDTTPNRYDNQWAKELSEYMPDDPKAAPVCDFNQTKPKQAHCIAPFDVQYTQSRTTQPYLELLAWNTNSYDELLTRVVLTAGLFNYGGFLSSVNLCTSKVCSDDQWSFFSLSSSSWFRLTSLGLPSTWVGHKYAVMRHGGLNDLVQPPPGTEAVNSTLHQQQDPIEVKRNIGGWDAANRMVERVLHLPFIHLSKDLKQQQQKP